MLPLQGARVQSLDRELRSRMPCGMAKNKKKKNFKKRTTGCVLDILYLDPCMIQIGEIEAQRRDETSLNSDNDSVWQLELELRFPKSQSRTLETQH